MSSRLCSLAAWFACAFVVAPQPADAQAPNVVIFHRPGATGPLSSQIDARYGRALAPSPAESSTEQLVRWNVFYATNRVRHAVTNDAAATDPVPAAPGQLEFGLARVKWPRQREKGEDAVTCEAVRPLAAEAFFAELSAVVARAPEHDVLVFVHGYNVGFEAALCRAGQLASDLPFNGAMVAFSWPSAARLTGYRDDERQVAASTSAVARFLTAIRQRLPTARIHLAAHSMGNRALLRGVAELPARLRHERPFHHVVLAAPDVGIDEFPTLATVCRDAAERVTLYASRGDEALKVSQAVHRIARAGDATRPQCLPGIDTIDVTAVDASFLGHSYYGSNRSVLNELFQLVKLDRPPDQRPWLELAEHDGRPYWRFVRRPPELRRLP